MPLDFKVSWISDLRAKCCLSSIFVEIVCDFSGLVSTYSLVQVSNLSPNWALIASLMALFVASLIGLLITVIIWKPTAWGLLPADKIRPRYEEFFNFHFMYL